MQTQTKATPFERLCDATRAEQAELHRIGVIQKAVQGEIDLATYVAFLSEAYHHVKHTVPLLMLTGARLPEELEWLRENMAEYIEEELGHQRWILNDIRNAGGDADAVAAGEPGFDTELMVAYAYDSVTRVSPLCFLGMVHVLEGTSVQLATRAAKAIREKLGLPNKAFSYLISHGDLDQDHVGFFEQLVNRLNPAQLDIVITSCKRFYRLYGNIFRALEVRA